MLPEVVVRICIYALMWLYGVLSGVGIATVLYVQWKGEG